MGCSEWITRHSDEAPPPGAPYELPTMRPQASRLALAAVGRFKPDCWMEGLLPPGIHKACRVLRTIPTLSPSKCSGQALAFGLLALACSACPHRLSELRRPLP